MTLPEPTNSRYLFVDLNSFFASCEQADNPVLFGKPLIVVPTESSCALAASYEAKAYGIKTGTREREARLLCPKLIVIKARPKRYMEFHYRFEAVLRSLTPAVTMRSVDEASVLLCRNENPKELANNIKTTIWRQISPCLHCSIGIAPNILLAKLGTEMQKPNGLVEITLQSLPFVYSKIKLTDLCGINTRLETQLNEVGIFSVLDFYHKDPEQLRKWFGVNGYRWWLQLHGYASYEHTGQRQSISHSHVLPPNSRQPQKAYTTMLHLASKVALRLRKNAVMSSKIALFVRFLDGEKKIAQAKTGPTSDTIEIIRQVKQLWHKINPLKPVMKLSVWSTNLKPNYALPIPLFEPEQKRLRLAHAMDKINDKYGRNIVRLATLDASGSRAPDRISFNALLEIDD